MRPAGRSVRYGEPASFSRSRHGRRTARRIAAVGRGADGSAIYVFTTPESGATPRRAGDRLPQRRPSAVLPVLVAGRRALTFLTTEPDGLALRLAPADASGAATAIREGAPMYWAWADATACSSTAAATASPAFFGEVRADGVATEPAAILTGRVPRPGRHERWSLPGIRRTGRRDTGNRSWSRRATGPIRTTVDVFGVAAIEFGPTLSELAFIAAAEPGRE